MFRILSLDPATNCGYSWYDVTGPVLPTAKAIRYQSGVWDLSVKRHESPGMRFLRLVNFIQEVNPKFIIYEEVVRHRGTQAAHIYGGIVSHIQSYCTMHDVMHQGVTVQQVKRRATGKGSAGKPDMVNHANNFFDCAEQPLDPAAKSKDDNIADAMWIMQIALEEYATALWEAYQQTQENKPE